MVSGVRRDTTDAERDRRDFLPKIPNTRHIVCVVSRILHHTETLREKLMLHRESMRLRNSHAERASGDSHRCRNRGRGRPPDLLVGQKPHFALPHTFWITCCQTMALNRMKLQSLSNIAHFAKRTLYIVKKFPKWRASLPSGPSLRKPITNFHFRPTFK